ncbi:nickel-dependent hydrogenase large subunit, partial [Acidiphilium sp.]|uniref:nickel-dependent hydrogenase large subunit n=1 Tax=Acidiphilium sp. TaxID=527 RepID=UPI003D018F83
GGAAAGRDAGADRGADVSGVDVSGAAGGGLAGGGLAGSGGLLELLVAAPAEGPVRLIDAGTWRMLARGEAALHFYGLFVSGARVYALFGAAAGTLLVATDLADSAYPSIAAGFPMAAWFERLARDLTGAVALEAEDRRPAIAQGAAGSDAAWPRFIETAGEGGFQIGQGPVAGVIAAPVHRRFSLDGGVVTRLEHRLGYAHRGIAGLMRGKSPRAAARFAARIAGDATVAHAVAFARAAEAASGVAAPPRAAAVRAVMLAIERVTGDLAALSAAVGLGGDARFAALLGQAREQVAGAVGEVFGHRLMMDVVVPGGLAVDVRSAAVPALVAALDRAGMVVRAVFWARVRRDLAAAAGMAQARARAVRAMGRVARQGLAALPEGIIAQALPAASGMGLGVAESARGLVHHWLDLADGQIRDCCAIDASARLLAVLEAVVVGLEFEAAAMVIACFGLSVSAIDG